MANAVIEITTTLHAWGWLCLVAEHSDVRAPCSLRPRCFYWYPGSAAFPRLVPPHAVKLVLMPAGQSQPASWLGKGYLVRMDTGARNTLLADWRFVQELNSSQDAVYFIQTKFTKSTLAAPDVRDRFEALQKEFARQVPGQLSMHTLLWLGHPCCC